MTAVEWLEIQFEKYTSGGVNIPNNKIFKLTEKAKAMEKEQIIDAHIEGQRVFDKHEHTQWTTDQAEEYYNETYKYK
jgi:hypothetical protein